MKYVKPEVVLLGSALVAVQKVDKGIPVTSDGRLCTQHAYEADE